MNTRKPFYSVPENSAERYPVPMDKWDAQSATWNRLAFQCGSDYYTNHQSGGGLFPFIFVFYETETGPEVSRIMIHIEEKIEFLTEEIESEKSKEPSETELTVELLKTDVPKWNRLSAAGAKIPDLSHAKLSGAALSGAHLRGVNFRGADLVETDFARADLRDTIFRDAWLYRANLGGADLKGAIFSDGWVQETTIDAKWFKIGADVRGLPCLTLEENVFPHHRDCEKGPIGICSSHCLAGCKTKPEEREYYLKTGRYQEYEPIDE